MLVVMCTVGEPRGTSNINDFTASTSQEAAYLCSSHAARVRQRERYRHDGVMQPAKNQHVSMAHYFVSKLHVYQGSSEEPGPLGWRAPPAVEPVICRFE